MTCLENTRKATQRVKRNQWFRRMFTVALLMGLVVGFFLGRFTAYAFGRTTAEPDTEPSQTVDIQPTQTVIPTPEVSLEPMEPEPERFRAFKPVAFTT